MLFLPLGQSAIPGHKSASVSPQRTPQATKRVNLEIQLRKRDTHIGAFAGSIFTGERAARRSFTTEGFSCFICLRAYVVEATRVRVRAFIARDDNVCDGRVRRHLGINGGDQEEESDSDGGNEGGHVADFEQETERANCYNVVTSSPFRPWVLGLADDQRILIAICLM